MVSPRDAQRNGITPSLHVSFPPPTPTACSGAGDGRMRAGHLSHSARHPGGGSRGGRAGRVWQERPVLGSHLGCGAASYLKVTDLGHPQPSELAGRCALPIAFSPCTYVVMGPWCLLSQKRRLIFALCITKVCYTAQIRTGLREHN